jgi:integrase
MSLYKRNDVWWIYLGHQGRRVRRSTGTSDRQAAKRQHDELAARLHSEVGAGQFLSDALLAWADKQPRAKSELSRSELIMRLYEDRPLTEVTADSVRILREGRSNATYNRLLTIIHAAMVIAQRLGWINNVPHFQHLDEPVVDIQPLSPTEWQGLCSELPPHLLDLAEFALATGLRWSNVSMLEWDQLDEEKRIAWIHAKHAKGKKPIGVPLSDAALAVLSRLSRDTPWVFTYNGLPISRPYTAWRKAVKRAGLPQLRFHDLRHTWASWHAMGGTPLDALQKLGGWTTPKMVQRYSHLAPSYLAQFANNATNYATQKTQKRKKRPPTEGTPA